MFTKECSNHLYIVDIETWGLVDMDHALLGVDYTKAFLYIDFLFCRFCIFDKTGLRDYWISPPRFFVTYPKRID